MISSIDGEGAPILEIATYPNQRLFFVRDTLDDYGMPPDAFRLLFHLRRRIGNGARNPGIAKMSTVCRMEKKRVISALQWLEARGIIKVNRNPGKLHQYRLLLDNSLLFVHSRIDDFKLSISEFRVLGHMARLSGTDGEFYINKSQFSRVCCLHRETIDSTLVNLEDKELFCTGEDRKNPRCFLTLCDRFPDASISKVSEIRTVHQSASKSTSAGCVENQEWSMPESRNGTLEGRNGLCRKAVTKGDPEERGSRRRDPIEGNPAPSGKPKVPALSRSIDDEILNGFEKDPTWADLNIRKEFSQMQTERGRTQIKASNFVEWLLRVRKTILQPNRI